MSAHKHTIVVGLGYGDEGKGTTVDYLVRRRESKLVVRFNGGAQAGHNVVLPDGTHHCFSQFGAGTLAGARTFLSSHVVVNPATMMREADVLSPKISNPLESMHVDEQCLVTTRYHMAMNRLRELARGAGRHGSCGMGVGETVGTAERYPELAIRVCDLRQLDAERLHHRLVGLAAMLRVEVDNLDFDGRSQSDDMFETWHRELACLSHGTARATAADLIFWSRDVHVVGSEWLTRELQAGPVIFEGAQGVLLDQERGFFPHVTRSKTTAQNALRLLRAHLPSSAIDIEVLGVVRTYMTRHGAGPFPTHDRSFGEGEPHNERGPWQDAMRFGLLDIPSIRYAARATHATGLVLTHLDRHPDMVCAAIAWQIEGLRHRDLLRESATDMPATYHHVMNGNGWPVYEDMSINALPEAIGLPLRIASYGPTHLDKSEAV